MCVFEQNFVRVHRKVLRDEYLAYRSALLFCINPASIFFTSAYSESMHAALSFMLMLKVEKGFSFQMATFLALSTGVRSNALLNLGFVAYKGIRIIAKEIAIHVRLKQVVFSTLLFSFDGCLVELSYLQSNPNSETHLNIFSSSRPSCQRL